MQGEIKADLAVMPLANMALLFGGIAVLFIVAAVVFMIMVRKLGIKNIGPIKMEQQNQTTMHSMNEATKDADDDCKRQLRHITSSMKIHISNILHELNVCTIARIAISSAIRFPLYESVANNHFTRELMPENYDMYREQIINMMEDEYVSLSSISKESTCNISPLPEWEKIRASFVECIDQWLKKVAREIIINCERKIKIYKKYEIEFKAAGDEYRLKIIRACVEKNEGYIITLKRRIG